jgi:hypothetical protein
MKLEDLKEAQMEEIMRWAGELDTMLTPDNVRPTALKEFPLAIETSERLKRICKKRADELKAEALAITDTVMDAIEKQEYVYKLNCGGQPVYKKKFATVNQRQRELRIRLASNETYQQVKADEAAWKIMYSDWVSHASRLHREMRILEVDYMHSGGDTWQQEEREKQIQRANSHPNRLP